MVVDGASPREPPEATGRTDDPALRLTLLDGLAQLPPRDRAVLVPRYWDDRSVEQAAHLLDLSPGAVRTRSARSLQRLRPAPGGQLADPTTTDPPNFPCS